MRMNRKCIIETKFPSLFLSEGGSSDGDPVCMRARGMHRLPHQFASPPIEEEKEKSAKVECASAFKLRLKILPVESKLGRE